MPATTSAHLTLLDEADATIEALRFLSDGNRLRILRVLSRRESCVCELIEQLGQPQPLVSYHLRRLREAGLVRSRRQAQWVYYSLDPAAWECFTRPIRAFCDPGELPREASYDASQQCIAATNGRPGASQPSTGAWPED